MGAEAEGRWRLITTRQVHRPTFLGWLVVLALLLMAGGAVYLARQSWLPAVMVSLIHEGPVEPADAIVVENYGHDYLAFERAGELVRDGYSQRVYAPVASFRNPERPGLVAGGFAEVMTRVAGLPEVQIIPVREDEPVTLTVARQVAAVLAREDIRSVILVAPNLRSGRSARVYSRVLEPMGIRVYCCPSRNSRTPQNWWHSLHGIQEVGLELGKHWYYRLWVLPPG